MNDLLGFDLLVGILALQGLIVDMLILLGIGFLAWLWLADRKLNKQQERNEYEALKQSLYDHIE